MEDLTLGHLSDDQLNEVILIINEDSPLDVEPATWIEHAFLNEAHFQPSRDKIERERNQERLTRLMELGALPGLGAVPGQEDEILDWSQVDEQDLL